LSGGVHTTIVFFNHFVMQEHKMGMLRVREKGMLAPSATPSNARCDIYVQALSSSFFLT
jgi:hypothetical protein